MGLVKITFDGSSVSAKQDADINYHLNGLIPAGVLKGLGSELSVSTSNNYITFQSGYVEIYGRRIFVEANTQIYISLDSTKYGYVLIDVNLNDNSVNLTKAENSSTYPSLTQQDLSNGGIRYDLVTKKKQEKPELSIQRVFCFPMDKHLHKPPRWFQRKEYEAVECPIKDFDWWYTAIYYRNCAMIDRSDLVLFCVEQRENSGAYKTFEYAVKKKKKFINLYGEY